MDRKIQHIGIFTSGGDAPGMNACIRAVVRSALNADLMISGIGSGYQGMLEGDFVSLGTSDVSNIIQRGGTILKASRCEEFKTSAGMQKAYDNLRQKGIDALIAIGGDGTFRGANEFISKFNFPVIGIPGTIDNDMYGTDFTIGYDTAINTVVEAVDKIRDTAEAHNRLFIIEVMGKDAGFIALRSGIAVGAEAVLIPETKTHVDELIAYLQRRGENKNSSSIIIVAEGDDAGGALEIAAKVKEHYVDYDTRVSILGHMQRGGAPTCMDRVLASRLGVGAVTALLEGKTNEMIGIIHRDISFTPFEKACKHHKNINKHLLNIVETLSG